jgi:GH15 family glucan-1,4-alpha-glucosidase
LRLTAWRASWSARRRLAAPSSERPPKGSARKSPTQSWNVRIGSFVDRHGGDSLDASLLQMARLRFLQEGNPRLSGTIDAIARELAHEGWLLRYNLNDGFGKPSVAFVICSFWLIDALACAGRRARSLFDRIHGALSPLGLLSEDYDTATSRTWGNFPQTYSHVGLIHAAFAASPQWADVL